MYQLFAYGSLICEDIMRSVAGPCEPLGEASLQHYRRLAVTGEHYPGMIHAPGFSVQGRVYRGISTAGLDRLDRFEGGMYRRTEVEVELADGGRLVVFTYLIRDACRHRLASREWHLEAFLKRGKQAFTDAYVGFDQLPGDDEKF